MNVETGPTGRANDQGLVRSSYLTDLWYLATPGHLIKPGQMIGKVFMERPVLIGRRRDGTPFALRNLCPHRGVPLSEGTFDGVCISCPFHGWRFRPDGTCAAIPSLVQAQSVALGKIRVRTYPCREVQGNIWVYLSESDTVDEKALPEPFQIPDIGERPYNVATPLTFHTDVDNAVFGLLDPAHGPYVHRNLLWRQPDRLKEKAKAYVPSELGFTMVRHPPSSNSVIYHFLGGDRTTEISFRLPGIRLEHVRVGPHHICNLTTITPVDSQRTEVTNFLYWTQGWLSLFKPFFSRFSRAFLGQDQWIIDLQNEGLKYRPDMMLINDADIPQKWYLRLKKAWREAQEANRPFVNPVKPATLKWRT